MTGAATVVTYSVSDENGERLHNLVGTLLIPAARDAQGYGVFSSSIKETASDWQ